MGLDRANPRALSAPATAGQGRDGAMGPGLPLGSHTCLPTGTASLPMDGADMHPDTANQDKSNFFVVLGGNALGGEEGRERRAKQQVGVELCWHQPSPRLQDQWLTRSSCCFTSAGQAQNAAAIALKT